MEKQLLSLNVAIIPFDAIGIDLAATGLCPTGLGAIVQQDMAVGLYTALRCDILPDNCPRLDNVVTMIGTTDATNGYDLLWKILALYVPGFKHMVQPEFPDWFDQVQDVFCFAAAAMFFF